MSEAIEKVTNRRTEPPLAGGIADRSSPTCLVVEDDSTMRHLVTNYLEDHDLRVVSASRRLSTARMRASNSLRPNGLVM